MLRTRICRRLPKLIGAVCIALLGVLVSSPGRAAPTAPYSSAAMARAGAYQEQQYANDSRGMTQPADLGPGERAVVEVLPVIASATFFGSMGGSVRGGDVVVQPATFIHHMVIVGDSFGASQQPQSNAC